MADLTAVIALNRMAFGPRPGDLDAFRAFPGATFATKLQWHVDQQLNPSLIDDRDCEARLRAANLKTLHKTLEQLWDNHVAHNPYKDTEAGYAWRFRPMEETRLATLLRAVYSRRQLVEVLADFWHNHFNVYGWNDNIAPIFVHYDRDVIRAHLLGNFREMLEAVALSPTMLYYLDNYSNQVAGPNENYARELFELHTLGAENYLGVRNPMTVPGYEQHAAVGYVDNDVYEAARCFTGWRVNDNDDNEEEGVRNTGTFLYYKSWHDRFNKIVLGKYIPHDQEEMKDGREVLDAVAFHPGAAQHMARKLCRRFIADHPPERLVNAAAEVFLAKREEPDQLKQVMRVILLSDEFRTTWGAKMKRPFEVVVSGLRALSIDFNTLPDAFFNYLKLMGQPLFEHKAPNGYPDVKEDWTNTMSMLHRWNFATALVEGRIGDDEKTITVDLMSQMPSTVRTPHGIVAFWMQRLLGRPLSSEASRMEIARFLTGDGNPDDEMDADQIKERLPRAVELILCSPEFQWR